MVPTGIIILWLGCKSLLTKFCSCEAPINDYFGSMTDYNSVHDYMQKQELLMVSIDMTTIDYMTTIQHNEPGLNWP